MVGDILQPTHLLLILIVALVVLGPKRLPEAGRALGNGLRDFRAAISGESNGDGHSWLGESHHDETPHDQPEASAAPQALPSAAASVSAAEPAPVETATEPATPAPVVARPGSGQVKPAPSDDTAPADPVSSAGPPDPPH